MACRLVDSCSAYASAADVLTAGYTGALGTYQGSSGRWGTGAIQIGGGNGNRLSRAFAAGLSSWVVGFVYKCTASSVSTGTIIRCLEGVTLHLEVRPDATDHFSVTRNGTLLGTSATQIVPGTHYVLQLKFTISNGAGVAQLYVNDNLEINLSGVDTQNAGTGVVDNFIWGGQTLSSEQEVSEIYVNDTTGSAPNNGVWGSYRIYARRVTAAGAHSDFTPLASTNASNVDDTQGNDGDTTYNSSSTSGHRDTFQLGAVPPVSGTIPAIMHRIVARKDDAGVRTIAPTQRQSSTDQDGTSQNLVTTYAHYTEVLATNPQTGVPFTMSEMRSTTPEFGYKLVA